VKISRLLLSVALLALSIAYVSRGAAQTSYLTWQPNVAYKIGDQVTYQDSTHPNHRFKCQQAHTSLVGWEPPNTPALWIDEGAYGSSPTNTPTTLASNTPTTTPKPTSTNTPKPANTNVPTATNTSVPPTLTPTTSGVLPAWAPNVSYKIGDQVTYQDSTHPNHLYKCQQAHTSLVGWEPPNAPAVWIDEGLYKGGSATSTPTSGPSATLTKTSTPAPTSSGGSLPEHLVTGYWQDFTNGATALHLRDVPTTYTIVAVAFANADPRNTGGVTFSIDSGLSSALGGYSAANFTSDLSTLHSQGRKVIISVGGQNGTISVSDPTSASNFANSVYSLMQQYGFDGVDIDLENGINVTYMSSALQQLSAKAGSGLIVTLAPQTIDMQSTGSGYLALALNIKSILTIVNTQYYNSGSMNGCDGKVYAEGNVDFLTALACIQLQGGLRPDQVGLGLPANSSGAGSGAVAPSVVNAALDCLETGNNCGSFHPSQHWTGIRGAMDWSINWDASAGYNFANTVQGHFNAQP